MQIDIRGQSIDVSAALQRAVQQRVKQALERFAAHILHVTVCLEDPGGPRRGGGIRCRIAIAVCGAGHITADVLDVSVLTAVDRAVEQGAYAVARDLGQVTARAVAMPSATCASASSVFRRVERQYAEGGTRTREEFTNYGFGLL